MDIFDFHSDDVSDFVEAPRTQIASMSNAFLSRRQRESPVHLLRASLGSRFRSSSACTQEGEHSQHSVSFLRPKSSLTSINSSIRLKPSALASDMKKSRCSTVSHGLSHPMKPPVRPKTLKTDSHSVLARVASQIVQLLDHEDHEQDRIHFRQLGAVLCRRLPYIASGLASKSDSDSHRDRNQRVRVVLPHPLSEKLLPFFLQCGLSKDGKAIARFDSDQQLVRILGDENISYQGHGRLSMTGLSSDIYRICGPMSLAFSKVQGSISPSDSMVCSFYVSRHVEERSSFSSTQHSAAFKDRLNRHLRESEAAMASIRARLVLSSAK